MEPYAGLINDVRDALLDAPESERSLLELRLAWPALREREARIAARLRVFLLTWDPFWWMRDRGWAWATATGDGDAYEVVLYLTLHDAVRRARETARTLADVLGDLAGLVLIAGARHEQLLVAGAFPQLAVAGEVPGLLSESQSARGQPAPELDLAADGWEPIGLGAIQDLAQERFGPVDLDRSQVRLKPVAEPSPSCPACAGSGSASRPSWTSSANRCAPSTPSKRRRSSPSGWSAHPRATARDGTRSLADPRCSTRRRSGCRSGC